MKKYCNLAHNPHNVAPYLNLLSVYNEEIYPPHHVIFEKNSGRNGMNCLIITLDGQGNIADRNNNIFSLNKNTLYFGHIQSSQSIYCIKGFWRYVCYWFSAIDFKLPKEGLYQIPNLDADKENADANKIIDLLKKNSLQKTLQANAYFSYKIIDVFDNLAINLEQPDLLVNKMIQFIKNHLTDDLRVSSLAQQFGYCEKHIRTLFQKSLHLSPQKFIMKAKLEQICEILLTSSITLQSLAEQFNFYSPSHLSAAFKKEYGLTPLEFKKINQPPTT